MSDTGLPRISIVTPSFNQGRFLERTIRSVLDQDYPNLEYMVFDGGSTDDSVEIIERYADRLSYWQSQPDGGQSAAINAGWRRATGEILAWLNSDDYYLPGTLQFAATYLAAHPQVQLLYGTCERVDQDGTYLGFVGSDFRMRDLLFSRQVIPQPSAFLRRKLVERVGQLDESLAYSMDYDLFLRIARASRPTFVRRRLAGATIHPDAKTTADRDRARAETHQLRLRYSHPLARPFVRFQPVQSRIYHAMPAPIRKWINRVRPRRVFGVARGTEKAGGERFGESR